MVVSWSSIQCRDQGRGQVKGHLAMGKGEESGGMGRVNGGSGVRLGKWYEGWFTAGIHRLWNKFAQAFI